MQIEHYNSRVTKCMTCVYRNELIPLRAFYHCIKRPFLEKKIVLLTLPMRKRGLNLKNWCRISPTPLVHVRYMSSHVRLSVVCLPVWPRLGHFFRKRNICHIPTSGPILSQVEIPVSSAVFNYRFCWRLRHDLLSAEQLLLCRISKFGANRSWATFTKPHDTSLHYFAIIRSPRDDIEK